MDKTIKYRELCQTALDLQEIKWKAGFHEGDYVYLGEQLETRPIGYNFFQVENGNTSEFNFVNADNIQFSPDPNLTTFEIKHDNYIIESICNPIWLPRQDQMESFYYQRQTDKRIDIKSWLNELLYFYDEIETNINMLFTPESNEQLALAYIMNRIFKIVWSKKDGWQTI